MDNLLTVKVLNASLLPQMLIRAAMGQDYSEEMIFDKHQWMSCYFAASYYCQDGVTEEEAGHLVVKHLLNGGRGHYGPLEHPQIVLNCGYFPHSTMQQIRTHRVGVSFDVQSFRYTGKRIYDLGALCNDNYSSFPCLREAMPGGIDKYIDEVFYLRPVGSYSDRNGKHYEYTEEMRLEDLALCGEAAIHYTKRINQGLSEEHARGLIPFDVRQHWVMSANVRSLMHLLDLRAKSDAQLECQWLCDLIWPHFEQWCPQIAEWYQKNRWGKARLAP